MAKKQSLNRISELRLNRHWSQGELADRCGAHWVTISKLERGQMQLTQEWMERLAEVLDVHPTEILSDPPLHRTIYVAGGIQDATTLENYNFITDTDSTSFEFDSSVQFSVQFGTPESDKTIWYIVDTEVFYPIIRNGDFVRFTYPAEYNLYLFLGRLCLIEPNDDRKIRVIGVPTRGSTEGLFDIQVFGKEMILDQKIEEMAYLSMVISNPDVDIYEDGSPKP